MVPAQLEKMNKAKRTEIFERFRNENPEPTTELEYSNAFELLIAVILSAQATDKGVNIATRKLFPVIQLINKAGPVIDANPAA